MPLTKQVRDCRIGDILLYKNEESRVITDITDINHRGEAYLIRTTELAGENSRFNTYNALDPIKVRGTQGVLF